MKKDNIRDYATEAFRFYASNGKINIRNTKNHHNYKTSEIADIKAVDKTLNEISDEDVEILNIVYFSNPNEKIKTNEIQNRVIEASRKLYCDERTVYRRLREIRYKFAVNRGLRT